MSILYAAATMPDLSLYKIAIHSTCARPDNVRMRQLS